MLRNIALRGTDLFDDILHADFLISQYAQDLQPQRMGNCLECTRRLLDMFVVFDQGGVRRIFQVSFLHDAMRMEARGGYRIGLTALIIMRFQFIYLRIKSHS